jgi:hypothetical protein
VLSTWGPRDQLTSGKTLIYELAHSNWCRSRLGNVFQAVGVTENCPKLHFKCADLSQLCTRSCARTPYQQSCRVIYITCVRTFYNTREYSSAGGSRLLNIGSQYKKFRPCVEGTNFVVVGVQYYRSAVQCADLVDIVVIV